MTRFDSSLSTFLGQGLFSKPESLPGTRDFAVWLFERPVQVALIFGLIAAVFAIKAMQRSKARLWALSIAFALFAGVGFTLGQLVTTDREVLRNNTRSFIQNVAEADAASAQSILSDEVSLIFGTGRIPGVGKEEILAKIPLVQRVGVTGAAVKELQATIEGDNAGRTQVQVRVLVGSNPTLTWWYMDWRKESDGQWRVFRLRCLLINGREPGATMYNLLR